MTTDTKPLAESSRASRVRAEGLITLDDATKYVPPGDSGEPVSTSAFLRWIVSGKRGVKLEATRVGGHWHTSIPAIGRFLAAVQARERQLPRRPRR
jgi:hypothetical protein